MSLTTSTWVVLAAAAAAAACGGTTATEVIGPSAIKCDVTLEGTSLMQANASQPIIQVTAARECEWSASTNASWLQPNPRAGTGSAVLVLTAEANPAAARTAILTVAERRWTV